MSSPSPPLSSLPSSLLRSSHSTPNLADSKVGFYQMAGPGRGGMLTLNEVSELSFPCTLEAASFQRIRTLGSACPLPSPVGSASVSRSLPPLQSELHPRNPDKLTRPVMRLGV